MQFYFIRHGQSSNNVLWDRTGSNIGRSHDPELTEAGQRQAEILASFLARTDPSFAYGRTDYYNAAGFGITHLYTSLMLRAVATGVVVARALQVPLVGLENVHESGGLYLDDPATGKPAGQPGSSRSYFAECYPDLVVPESCDESGWWKCRPYEEHERAMERTGRFVEELLARHGGTDDRVAVISHGDFYNCFLRSLLRMESHHAWFTMNNAAITRIDFRNDECALVYTNRVDFLPRELVT